MATKKMVTSGSVYLNAKDEGAKGDARKFATGGSITTGTATLTLTGATFTAADVGKLIYVLGAGAAGAVLSTTISAYTDATHVTLAANAGTTVADTSVIYGTDDTAAINAVLSNMQNYGVNELLLPFGSYLVDALYLKNNAVIKGQQRGAWAYEFPERTSRLLAKPGMTGPAVINDFAGQQVGNVRLFDFMIDGNKAFQTSAKHGILLTDSAISADSLWTIERIYVGYVSGDGIKLGAYRRANRLNDVHVYAPGGHGYVFDGTDNNMMQSMAAACGGNGVQINQGANHFYGCDFFNNTGHGANIVPLGRMSQFTNCFFDTNMKAGVYNEAKNLSLTQCRFTSNSQEADAAWADIEIVGGAPGCALINPTFYLWQTATNLPHSAIRAPGNAGANLVMVAGFSHDYQVSTWRNGSYVEVSVGNFHKGFSYADGSMLRTGATNGTTFGGAGDKLAFFGKAPAVVQPSATPVAATDAATTQALVNDLRSKLIALGLIS